MISATCRYQHGVPCNGPGSLDFSLCAGCSGAVDISNKPAAHDRRREEVKTMAKAPAAEGKCPDCGEVGKQYASKLYSGTKCKRCWKRASNLAYNAAKKKPSPAAPAPLPAAAKPAAAPRQGAAKIAAPAAAGGLSLLFEVRLPVGATTLELMDVLRALPAGAKLA